MSNLEEKLKAYDKAKQIYDGYHRLRPDPMEPGYLGKWKHKDVEERLAVVGCLITQEDPYCGAIVLEHIKSSRYKIQLPDGSMIVANRAMGTELQSGLSSNGWYPVEYLDRLEIEEK